MSEASGRLMPFAEVAGNLYHNKSAAYLSAFLTTIPSPLTEPFSSRKLAWLTSCTDKKKRVIGSCPKEKFAECLLAPAPSPNYHCK